jgi:RimJ/RimL family protein N-acetyltransferase
MQFRSATFDDARQLFKWRNDETTRAMSRSTDAVEWDGHVKWLKSRLGRPRADIYIAEVDGHAIGTFRIDGDEVSYTIAPEYRRRGLCTTMLKMVANEHGRLRAEIFRRNVPSIRAATTAGLEVVLID